MAPVNPTIPNLADYRAFVYGLVFTAPMAPPYAAFPWASGTVSSGTSTTLTDSSATWADGQWIGCVVFDVTQGFGGYVTANTPTQATFIPASVAGAQLASAAVPAAGDSYLIVQASLAESLTVALAEVNEFINCASPLMYTKAVYNLAADRLLNFGIDVQGQTLLQDARTKFQLLDINVGTIQSGSDQGTAGSYLVPDQMQTFTMSELQLLKTPFGRAYISIAQAYGSTLFGVS